MSNDPIKKFGTWLKKAQGTKAIVEPTAMCLATADEAGKPTARMVLLKAADERGFVFYTNLGSRKANALAKNPEAALCFYWGALKRQVRIEGSVERVSDAEADAYFSTRPRDSQLGAWASKQSQPLSSLGSLLADVTQFATKFAGKNVPRPPHWSGFRIVPNRIEFWEEGAFRLHKREVFTRGKSGWKTETLYP